jgi:hypothetical protein
MTNRQELYVLQKQIPNGILECWKIGGKPLNPIPFFLPKTFSDFIGGKYFSVFLFEFKIEFVII